MARIGPRLQVRLSDREAQKLAKLVQVLGCAGASEVIKELIAVAFDREVIRTGK